jgi:hypothetical protein
MLAGRNRGAGMLDANGGIAGRFHHHVHGAAGDGTGTVIGECRGGNPRLVPADRAAGFAGALTIDVDDD